MNSDWLTAGVAPATAPNTGKFFCPEFKISMHCNDADDANTFVLIVTYVIESRGDRFGLTV